ncbi:MAG: hypothetical protein MUF26_00655 [Syntrophales bacterium]|nr:hypothetical protein [Syntrophales bacterium]
MHDQRLVIRRTAPLIAKHKLEKIDRRGRNDRCFQCFWIDGQNHPCAAEVKGADGDADVTVE